MNDLQTLQQMIKKYRDLPYDKYRADLTRQALALAEELNLPYYRLDVRYDLIWAYAMGDDPAKALPVCAEFFTLLEEHPDVLGRGPHGTTPSARPWWPPMWPARCPRSRCRSTKA